MQNGVEQAERKPLFLASYAGILPVTPASGWWKQESWEFQANPSHLVTSCLSHKQKAGEATGLGLCCGFLGRLIQEPLLEQFFYLYVFVSLCM